MKIIMIIRKICFFLLIFLCSEGVLFASPQHLTTPKSYGSTITIGLRDIDDIWGRLHTAIYTEAFERLGVDVKFREFPLARLSYITDNNEFLDGDISRVFSYNESHHNLVRVEEPHSHSAIVAYSTNPCINIDGGWDSLKQKELMIDYRFGSKTAAEELNKRIPSSRLNYVHSDISGLKRLIEGRADIFISSGVVAVLKEGSYQGSRIYEAGVIERTTFHLFLLNKHKDLAKKII